MQTKSSCGFLEKSRSIHFFVPKMQQKRICAHKRKHFQISYIYNGSHYYIFYCFYLHFSYLYLKCAPFCESHRVSRFTSRRVRLCNGWTQKSSVVFSSPMGKYWLWQKKNSALAVLSQDIFVWEGNRFWHKFPCTQIQIDTIFLTLLTIWVQKSRFPYCGSSVFALLLLYACSPSPSAPSYLALPHT